MLPPYKYPVPENAPDEGVFITVAFNIEWLPIVLSQLQGLKSPFYWDNPPDTIAGQVDTLIVLLQTNLD